MLNMINSIPGAMIIDAREIRENDLLVGSIGEEPGCIEGALDLAERLANPQLIMGQPVINEVDYVAEINFPNGTGTDLPLEYKIIVIRK